MCVCISDRSRRGRLNPPDPPPNDMYGWINTSERLICTKVRMLLLCKPSEGKFVAKMLTYYLFSSDMLKYRARSLVGLFNRKTQSYSVSRRHSRYRPNGTNLKMETFIKHSSGEDIKEEEEEDVDAGAVRYVVVIAVASLSCWESCPITHVIYDSEGRILSY
jgi:hypothetical protein